MEIKATEYQGKFQFQQAKVAVESRFSSKIKDVGSSFLAGCLSGTCTVLVGHPFDTIKVRMQMINTSFRSCVKDVVSKEGVSALYKGIASPLLSVPLLRASGWLTLELGLKLLGSKYDENLGLSQAMLAGSFSALVTSLIVSPFDLVKCRLQMEGVGAKIRRTGAMHLGMKIFKEEGLRGLYRGYSITLAREIPGVAVSYGAFQYTRTKLREIWGEKTYNSFISGAVAGVACWLCIYPQDLVKTRTQNGGQTARKIISDILQKEGFKGFWRGFGACMTRAPIAVAVGYGVYEEARKLFSQ
jgi:solute carrier family 25 carnitine/acylcarnitine transporter 20/29